MARILETRKREDSTARRPFTEGRGGTSGQQHANSPKHSSALGEPCGDKPWLNLLVHTYRQESALFTSEWFIPSSLSSRRINLREHDHTGTLHLRILSSYQLRLASTHATVSHDLFSTPASRQPPSVPFLVPESLPLWRALARAAQGGGRPATGHGCPPTRTCSPRAPPHAWPLQ